MNDCTTSALPRPIPLGRPWSRRLGDWWRQAKAWWAARARRRREERDIEVAAELNEAMLRDIGAPDWLQAYAQARREAHLQRLQETRLGLEHRPLGERW